MGDTGRDGVSRGTVGGGMMPGGWDVGGMLNKVC